MKRWIEALAVYRDPRMVAILFLGFSSGLPLALTTGTLAIWLARSGVDKTTIGLFALVGLPYTLKFVWAPVIDRAPVPLLTRLLGRRRGWLIATQGALMAATLALGSLDVAAAPATAALLALVVAFVSASQDIVVDAYRIDILDERQQGAGAAATQFGYRLGMLASGAGALLLADRMPWSAVYAVMAALVGVGVTAVLLAPEPEAPSERGPGGSWLGWIERAVIAPFADFLARPGWVAILMFILLYKFGDAFAGVMANPFYVEMGFTNSEIAGVSKVFGLGATLAGVAIGGAMVGRWGAMPSLLVCGVLQMLSNLMFALQAVVGHSVAMLGLTIAVENLSGGMGSAAFVAYLSGLCHLAYTATQYALLSSFMAFGRTALASTGGWLADRVDWVSFFVVSTAVAVPGLVLLLWLMRRPEAPPAGTRISA